MTKLELSEIIIGSILLTPELYDEVISFLRPVMFDNKCKGLAENLFRYIEQNGTLKGVNEFAIQVQDENYSYQEILSLIQKGDSLNFLKLSEQLKTIFINESEIVFAETTISKLKRGENWDEVIPQIEAERELLLSFTEKPVDDKKDQLNKAYDDIYFAVNNTKKGIPSGLPEIDNVLTGWHRTDLNIIAGRPGMGKSTFAFGASLEAAENGFPTVIFSQEMSRNQVWQKLASMKTGIPTMKMRSGKLTEFQLAKIHEEIQRYFELPLFVETGYFNIYELRSRLRILKRKYGIAMMVLDYLQLCRTERIQDDTKRIGEVARVLKEIASEGDCNLNIMALAQLNRNCEKRPNKRPQLSDLEWSGAIEQNADSVSFLYRHEYYHPEENLNEAEFIISKNRHGMVNTIKLGFQGKFYSLGVELEKAPF